MHVPGPMVQVEEEASCMWAEWPDFQSLWYGHRASVVGTLNGAKKKWKCHFFCLISSQLKIILPFEHLFRPVVRADLDL